jgi:hypothetical protein
MLWSPPFYHSQKLEAASQYWEKKGLHFARIGKSDSEGVKIGWAAPWPCTVHTHSSNKLAQKQLAPGHNVYAAIQKENLLATKWNDWCNTKSHMPTELQTWDYGAIQYCPYWAVIKEWCRKLCTARTVDKACNPRNPKLQMNAHQLKQTL